jgi:hypothetical protein
MLNGYMLVEPIEKEITSKFLEIPKSIGNTDKKKVKVCYNGSDNEDDEMDVHEYRKFLSKIFPSKHLNNKIKTGDKLKHLAEELESDDEDEVDDEDFDDE